MLTPLCAAVSEAAPARATGSCLAFEGSGGDVIFRDRSDTAGPGGVSSTLRRGSLQVT